MRPLFPAEVRRRLEEIDRRLHRLLALRAALAPFRAALRADEQGPGERRHLLALWRPCQERMDLLLDATPEALHLAVQLRLLRREVEGHLLDEVPSPTALADAAEALEQVCEGLLLWVARDLRKAVEEVGEPPDEGALL